VGDADPLTTAPAWALALIHEARVGRLATADRDGRPLVVPVCYVVDAGRLWSAIDAKPKRTRNLRRLRNLAENPHVSLCLDLWDEDWTRLAYVIVEGTADVCEHGDDRRRAVDRLLDKYPQYRTMALDRDAGAVVRIAPRRIIAWRARDAAPASGGA
jgi:PPOX class probable F420-dependent enzyme